MYLPEDHLEEAVQRAVAKRLGVDIRSVKVARGVDDDGDNTIFVTLRFSEGAARLKRGYMFDLVATVGDALRSAGEFTPAVVYAHPKKTESLRAH